VKITSRRSELRFEKSQLIDQGLKSISTEPPHVVEAFSTEFSNISPMLQFVEFFNQRNFQMNDPFLVLIACFFGSSHRWYKTDGRLVPERALKSHELDR